LETQGVKDKNNLIQRFHQSVYEKKKHCSKSNVIQAGPFPHRIFLLQSHPKQLLKKVNCKFAYVW